MDIHIADSTVSVTQFLRSEGTDIVESLSLALSTDTKFTIPPERNLSGVVWTQVDTWKKREQKPLWDQEGNVG